MARAAQGRAGQGRAGQDGADGRGVNVSGVMYQIIVALIFNAMDFLTGLIGAAKTKVIQSSKLRDGLFKKVGFVLCYVLAFLIDTQGSVIGFEIGVKLVPIIVLYACTTEIVSIIENICIINPDFMPDKLKELFHMKGE